MLPEQLKAARALLNWSLERLARESGIHRNTISNFETRKFGGEPDTLATIKHTLENTGVIFPEENAQDAGISFRRFQLGDHVRLRPQSNIYSRYNVAEGEIGEVVWVEPHPPATGPTYRIHVKFEHAIVRGDFKFEYELVQAVSALSYPLILNNSKHGHHCSTFMHNFVEPVHQRQESEVFHVGDQVIEHTALSKQRVGSQFGCI